MNSPPFLSNETNGDADRQTYGEVPEHSRRHHEMIALAKTHIRTKPSASTTEEISACQRVTTPCPEGTDQRTRPRRAEAAQQARPGQERSRFHRPVSSHDPGKPEQDERDRGDVAQHSDRDSLTKKGEHQVNRLRIQRTATNTSATRVSRKPVVKFMRGDPPGR